MLSSVSWAQSQLVSRAPGFARKLLLPSLLLSLILHSGCTRHPKTIAGAAGDASDALARSAQAASSPKVAPPPPQRKNMPRSKDWSRVSSLIEEQKFEEARGLCSAIRAAAQKSGNSEEWTEAMIKEVQLQIALHGYETAVRLLRTESWPQDSLSQVALELYYAHSLMSYLQAYSWEIGRRERVETRGQST
jgi:hypothetical protein